MSDLAVGCWRKRSNRRLVRDHCHYAALSSDLVKSFSYAIRIQIVCRVKYKVIMSQASFRLFCQLILPLLWFGMPLLGAKLAGHDLRAYLAFPATHRTLEPEPFSWAVFLGLTLFVFVVITPFVVVVSRSASGGGQSVYPSRKFPLWGWLGVVLVGVAWLLAWNRFAWFERLQEYTFTPLWLGYIVVINALTCARAGRCMLRHRTRYFLLLFPLSGIFWWGLEYLNRFVANWYYVGTSSFGHWQDFVGSMLPFSTVLPAVLGTAEWLKTFPRVTCGLDGLRSLGGFGVRLLAWLALVVGLAGLMGIALRPNHLYPLVWVAPLLLITGLIGIRENRTPVIRALASGDWRHVWLLMLASLACGFLWEMWNFYSLARWEYSVPYAQRFKLFEMPLLGYAGYLPFGILCGAIAEFYMPSYSDRGKRCH